MINRFYVFFYIFVLLTCNSNDYDREDDINHIEIKSIVDVLFPFEIGKETVELAPKCIVYEKSKVEEIHRLIMTLKESNTRFDPPEVCLRAKLKLEKGRVAVLEYNTRQIKIEGRVYLKDNELLKSLVCDKPFFKTK